MIAYNHQLEPSHQILTFGINPSVRTHASNPLHHNQLPQILGIKQHVHGVVFKEQIHAQQDKFGTQPNALVVAMLLVLILVTQSQAFAHAHVFAVMTLATCPTTPMIHLA
jgi:hypothetical protein